MYRNLTCIALAVWIGLIPPVQSQPPSPIHSYDLNGSLTDSLGGPSMVNNGGSLGADGIDFGPNQGPSLSSWIIGTATAGNYSIEMYFRITDTFDFRKLIDFKNRTDDLGLYVHTTKLVLYNLVEGPSGSIFNDTFAHVILTRNGSTRRIIGYVNGTQKFTGLDTANIAVFSSTKSVMHFFQDDTLTNVEASAGFVDFIRIYDRPLTSSEVAILYSVIPEPSATALLCGCAATAFGFVFWRTRRMRLEV